ncbi:MAG: hypothetical protein J6Y37_06450 [Paludibacteraceae bacterium]|nr:hypothetical protein [Paludibacteraceae bacterium]
MKKVVLFFAVSASLALVSCNNTCNKPAEGEGADSVTVVEEVAAVVDTVVAVADSAAVTADSAAAVVAEAVETVKEAAK